MSEREKDRKGKSGGNFASKEIELYPANFVPIEAKPREGKTRLIIEISPGCAASPQAARHACMLTKLQSLS